MKKMMLLLAVIAISIAGFSQLSIGLQGTGSLGDAKIKNEADFDYRTKMKAMPGAGIVVQYGFSEHFAIRSGANYIQNGVSLKATVDESVNMRVVLENNLNYVQIPVNFLYTIPVSKLQFFVGGGGYVSYGVSGKSKITLTQTLPDGSQSTYKEDVKAFEKEENGGAGLKKADYGLGAIAGLRIGRKLFVNAGYQFSLANIAESEDGGQYKNRSLQFTIGYFLR
jgi:hypothetical protein